MLRPRLPWVKPDQLLPPASQAFVEPNGLLCAGQDLSAARLKEAYGKGIFPWYSDGQPVLWWSPNPRMVLFVDEFKLHRSLRKTISRQFGTSTRPGPWSIKLNSAFELVMKACAAPREGQDGTWIQPAILQAYCDLHRQGLAHSVEVWEGARLIGGLYGVALGRMFYGESMFTEVPDASKCALSALVKLLHKSSFHVIDCQQNTRHLASLGAREIDRAQFLSLVGSLSQQTGPDWSTLAKRIGNEFREPT